MAKGIYVGVNSKARKVKKMYVGDGGMQQQVISGDIIPKAWAEVTANVRYVAADGTTLVANKSREAAKAACDGKANSSWLSDSGSSTDTLTLIFPNKILITKMKLQLYSANNVGTFYILGSNDNFVTNTELYSSTTKPYTLTEIALKNTNLYQSYQLKFAKNGTVYTAGVSEWQVSEYVIPARPPAARKVKKGYIGVGGKARLFFSSEKELSYYGTATDLSAARYGLAGASVGDYALFAGGRDKSTNYGTVESYNTSLTRASRASITARCFLASASVGNYALFAGGYNYSSTYYNNVDAFISTNLARTTATALGSSVAKFAGASVGDYAIFAGGTSNATGAFSNTCAYNSSLVQSTPSTLKTARYNLAGTSVGDYAIFGGGETASSRTNTVDAYNLSLTRSTPTAFSASKKSYAAANVGDYALFAGGYTTTSLSTVEVYNTTLTKSTPTELSLARTQLAGVSVDGYAIFAGGQNSSKKQSAVDVYDVTLTRTTPTELSVARFILAAASVGNYALFAGGYDGGATSSGAIPYATVDVYQSI